MLEEVHAPLGVGVGLADHVLHGGAHGRLDGDGVGVVGVDQRGDRAVDAPQRAAGDLIRIRHEIEQADGDQVEKMIPVLKSLTSDTDSVSVSVPPVGNLTLRVVEREEKCIKYALENVPINANLWIQLLTIDANSCKMKVTIGADLNLIMRGMLGGKLEKGAEGIANMLSRMPYTEF